MTGVDLLTITGIIVAAVVATNGIARLLPSRRARIQPLPPDTRPMDLGGLVIPLHDEHVATVTAQHQACHRCRIGHISFRCTCDSDCWAEHCTAAYASVRREQP